MLKSQLVTRTALPEQRRLQQLHTSTKLGDQRPTQLLRRMQQLLGGGADVNSFASYFSNVSLATSVWH